MKKLFYPLAFALSALLFIYSCSTEEDATPPPVPTPIVKYTISLSAGEGGSVSTTGGQYESGQTLNVTATPQAEYVFKSWSDGNTNATRTITVSSNTNLTATFEKKKYPLTINIQGEGSVTEEIVSTGKTTEYDSGTTVKLTAKPSEEWLFVGWSGDVESTENPIELNITQSKTVSATFEKKKYSLTVTAGEGGTVSTEGGTYDEGTEVTVTATPAEGYEFAGWEGSDSTEASLTITLTANTSLNALFDRSFFVSKSESFSPINQSTGYYNIQKYFSKNLDINLPDGNILDLLEDETVYYRTNTRETVFSDFNNDGKVDVFGFATEFDENNGFSVPYGYTPGKFVLKFDYQNSETEKSYFDSEISYAASKMLLNDFDGDGIQEVYMTTMNNKQNFFNSNEQEGGDVNLPTLKSKIIKVIDSNSINITDVGNPVGAHGGASGDLNNDGLADFIQVPIIYIEGDDDSRYPKTFLNQGNLEFSEVNTFGDSSLSNYFQIRSYTVEVFDLDDDGFLDLIFGSWFGPIEETSECCWGDNNYVTIFWGDGTGKFFIENSTFLTEENYLNNGTIIANRSFGFSDFDNDGDIDLVAGGTRSDSFGYYDTINVLLFENKGNREFKDITREKIDISSLPINGNGVCYFYSIQSIDKDGDGDIDLVPNQIGSWSAGGQAIKDFFWRKEGDVFIFDNNF